MIEACSILDQMNGFHLTLRGNLSKRDRERNEQQFYECHEQLRQAGYKFHMTPRGQWVIDEVHYE